MAPLILRSHCDGAVIAGKARRNGEMIALDLVDLDDLAMARLRIVLAAGDCSIVEGEMPGATAALAREHEDA